MPDLNVIFAKELLKETMKDVRKYTTVEQRKSVWTYNYHDGCWEVQSTGEHAVSPNRWYGRAANAYEARAKFWSQWLEVKQHKSAR